MSSEYFMLAACEARDYLKKGDVIRVDGVDHTYEAVADWAYIYSDKEERIDAQHITHVNGEPKRFGVSGVIDNITKRVMNDWGGIDMSYSELVEMVCSEVEKLEAHYYNTDHPDYKEMAKSRRIISE